MLDTAFTAIGSNFPSRFLLGQFFPVFAVLVVNVLLACLYFWGWEASLETVAETLKIEDLATAVGILAFAASVIAFTLSPLLNALRRLLEGDLIPEAVRAKLVASNEAWASELETEIDEITRYAIRLRQQRDASEAALSKPRPAPAPPPEAEPAPDPVARVIGWLVDLIPFGRKAPVEPAVPAPSPPAVPAPAPPAFDLTAAAAALDALEKSLRDADVASVRSRWDAKVGEEVFVRVVAAKEALIALKPSVGAADVARFEGLYDRLVDAFGEAIPVAARLLSDRKSAFRLTYVASDPRPTRFGNVVAALEHYPLSVYGVGYDYLWPRIQLVFEKDDTNAARLDDARTQLDYALVAMLLAMLSCAAWLILLVLTDTSWLRFLLVAFAAWLGFHLFYRVALEAQRTVTETMKAMLDRYRWDVLKALHVAVPADSTAERNLWQRLQSVSASVRLPTPLPYEKGQ